MVPRKMKANLGPDHLRKGYGPSASRNQTRWPRRPLGARLCSSPGLASDSTVDGARVGNSVIGDVGKAEFRATLIRGLGTPSVLEPWY